MPDDVDLCPDSPEDREGIEDWDGCPERGVRGEVGWGLSGFDAGSPESPPAFDDGDGIPGLKDACPLEPEDLDNFEDQDGCPDPDNDRDGIPDVKDQCPNEPENYNGIEDADGCPDPRGHRWGCARDSRLVKAVLTFDDDSAVIRPSDAATLDTILAYLHECPESLPTITLEGHAGAHERHPPALAAARAAAVRRYLVEHGIPSRSIQPVRHGRDPIRETLGNAREPEPDGRRVELHFSRPR